MLDLEHDLEAALQRIGNEVGASDRLEARLDERVRSRRWRRQIARVGAGVAVAASAVVLLGAVVLTENGDRSPANRVTTASPERQAKVPPLVDDADTVVVDGTVGGVPWQLVARTQHGEEEICTKLRSGADHRVESSGCVRVDGLHRRAPIAWGTGSSSVGEVLHGVAWRGVARVELELGGARPRTNRVALHPGEDVQFFATTVPSDVTRVTLVAHDRHGKVIFDLTLPYGDSPDVPAPPATGGQ
jgi:hypothetical protein